MRRQHSLQYSILTALILVALSAVALPARAFSQSASSPGPCNVPLVNPNAHFEFSEGSLVTPVATRNGCFIFATALGRNPVGLAVFRRTATGVEQVRFVALTGRPRMLALSPDEKTLFVGTGKNLAVLDVARLLEKNSDPLIGYVGDRRFDEGVATIDITPDGKHVFVLHPQTEWISIIDTEKARANAGASAIVGGMQNLGGGGRLALSPDGRYLFATVVRLQDLSLVPEAKDWPLTCNIPNSTEKTRDGALVVIDVQRAIAGSPSPIMGSARAGCGPIFIAMSPDGKTAYVVANGENAVLAFDVQSVAMPRLIGKVPVGASPISIATIHGGTKLVVANSDQYEHPDQPQSVTVIDASKMAYGSQAVLGAIPAGVTPRQLHVTADGSTLVLANNGTPSTLQLVDLERLPLVNRGKPQAGVSAECNLPAATPVHDLKIGGIPRFALASRDGCWIFLRVDNFTEGNTTSSGVAVLHREGGSVRQVRYVEMRGIHDTMAFTPNEKMLLVQTDRQIGVLDVAALMSGSGQSIRGYIDSPRFSNKGGTQTGAMPISRDGKYLFITQHPLAWISIIDLQKVEAGRFGAEAVAGGFATEQWPSGIVVAPDGRHLLYTANSTATAGPSLKCRPYGSVDLSEPAVAPPHAIFVADIEMALSKPESAIVGALSTRCGAAPLASSPDGRALYAISHQDGVLLAFDAQPVLQGAKAPMLAGIVPVGSFPRDVLVVDGGKKVIVANSNQVLGGVTDTETLTVIDTAKIASGTGAVLGTIPVGADPRYLSVTADGRTLLVSNYKSRTLQLIDLDRLPLQPVKP
jgi:DNA-binding beta-propeller fold protein YncE